MQQNVIPVPLPHEQREQITFPETFDHVMNERGFTVVKTRKVYTDPEVFRQQWLVCPNGTSYLGQTFYRLFGTTAFRKLLRYVLSHTSCTREMLEHICLNDTLLTSYLTFLLDQEWFHARGRWFDQGPYQESILNIGRTFEWYVAEWFRLTYSITHLVPVRHGVELAELPLQGDLDVVAFLDDGLVIMVECKSSSEVNEGHFSRFLQRVQAFHPTLAILLIDTPISFSQERLSVFNTALDTLDYAPLHGSRGFYRGTMNVYVVNVEHSIEISLLDVLRFHQWRVQSV